MEDSSTANTPTGERRNEMPACKELHIARIDFLRCCGILYTDLPVGQGDSILRPPACPAVDRRSRVGLGRKPCARFLQNEANSYTGLLYRGGEDAGRKCKTKPIRRAGRRLGRRLGVGPRQKVQNEANSYTGLLYRPEKPRQGNTKRSQFGGRGGGRDTGSGRGESTKRSQFVS